MQNWHESFDIKFLKSFVTRERKTFCLKNSIAIKTIHQSFHANFALKFDDLENNFHPNVKVCSVKLKFSSHKFSIKDLMSNIENLNMIVHYIE